MARQGILIPQLGDGLEQHGEGEHLVVFVHGYFASVGVFRPMARHLAARGVAPRQLHFNYVPAGSVARHAMALRDAIERARPRGAVSIIAHSLGGLVARYYTQILNGRLDCLVALATPHAGTDRAEGWPLTLARELSPGSGVIQTLEATRGRLSDTEVTSVVAVSDLLVHPNSASLHGSEVIRIHDTGHHGVLFEPEAWRAVERSLVRVYNRFDAAAAQSITRNAV